MRKLNESRAHPDSTNPGCALGVNFQEVVHSARTGNADVAKPQRFAEDRMDTHKNARLTPKGREEMVRAVVDRGMTAPRRTKGSSRNLRHEEPIGHPLLKVPDHRCLSSRY